MRSVGVSTETQEIDNKELSKCEDKNFDGALAGINQLPVLLNTIEFQGELLLKSFH